MTQILELATAPLQGEVLIEASAGTGKTYTLTGLFARLLLEKNLTVDQILVVTFTEAATEELRTNIRGQLKELADVFQEKNSCPKPWQQTLIHRFQSTAQGLAPVIHKLEQALRNFDLAQIFTIHGFCQRILTQNSFECRTLLNMELVPDLQDLYRQVCVDFWRQHILPLEGITGQTIRNVLTPDYLLELASIPYLVQSPRLEPQGLQVPDTWAIEQDIQGLCAQIARNWDLISQEVWPVFLSRMDTLHKKKFSKETLTERLQAVHDFVHYPRLDGSSKARNGLPILVYQMTQEYVNTMATKKSDPPQHFLFEILDQLKDQIAVLKTSLETRITALKVRFLDQILPVLDQRKQILGVQNFDDLLRQVHKALQYPELQARVRAQYQAALIDEFQDTDALQYQIFHTLFAQDHAQPGLFFIGDPKQAIYSFRGADLHTYLDAAQACQEKQTLGTNYRSTPALIAAINKIFSRPADPFLNPKIKYRVVQAPQGEHPCFMDHGQAVPPLTIWEAKSLDKPLAKNSLEPDICQAVTAEISRLLIGAAHGQVTIDEHNLKPGQIAILVETNDQGQAMHQALAQVGIASVCTQTASVWASTEARQLLSVLKGIVHCQNQTALRTALAMPLIGLRALNLKELDTKSSLLEKWFERFLSYRQLWERHGVMAAAQRLFMELQVRPRLVALPHGERRLTNILHCLELLQKKEQQTNVPMYLLLTWFQKQLHQTDTEDAQLRLETDRDAVQIVTIHKSKGLQYPVVFCPFVSKSARAHDGLALVHDNGLLLDLGSEQLEHRQVQSKIEDQGEKIRLLYVALTRAKVKCYLVWGYINQAETSGAAWLFHGHRADALQKLNWKTITQDQVSEDLAQLADSNIEVIPLPHNKPESVPSQTQNIPTLKAKIWQRDLGVQTSISSFTGLTRGTAYLGRPGLDENDAPGQINTAWTMANFPRGATAGTCLHQIFEHIDFTKGQTISPAVNTALLDYGFETHWQGPVETMIQAVLSADLQGFSLQEIDPKNRIVELEFLLPLSPINPETLIQVYQTSAPFLPANLIQQINQLRFEPCQGYLTGFADLVVRVNKRFYLLDWKSNWLGPEPQDYGQDQLAQAMAENLYFLQYHLYCLALNRYLARRISDYDPARDFGGVRYIFLRGVDPQQPGQGIYIDQPDPRFLSLLDQALIPQRGPDVC